MFKNTTIEDIHKIKGHIIPGIEKEIKETGGVDAYTSLMDYFKKSNVSCTFTKDTTPVCIFGVLDVEGDGLCWFFTSEEVSKAPLSFYKACKKFLEDMSKKYKKLYGHVSIDFEQSIDFFLRLGCKITSMVEYNKALGYQLEYNGGNTLSANFEM